MYGTIRIGRFEWPRKPAGFFMVRGPNGYRNQVKLNKEDDFTNDLVSTGPFIDSRKIIKNFLPRYVQKIIYKVSRKNCRPRPR